MRYIPSEEERQQAAAAAGRSGPEYYRIGDDGRTITCLTCQMTSHHPADLRYRYCGRCEVFHPAGVELGATPSTSL